jgi:hypothetical protein
MRHDTLTIESPTADDQTLPDLYRHPLSIDEIEVAGWGASWQPDADPWPTWLVDDDPCPPERDQATASTSWDLWPLLERFSP